MSRAQRSVSSNGDNLIIVRGYRYWPSVMKGLINMRFGNVRPRIDHARFGPCGVTARVVKRQTLIFVGQQRRVPKSQASTEVPGSSRTLLVETMHITGSEIFRHKSALLARNGTVSVAKTVLYGVAERPLTLPKSVRPPSSAPMWMV